ncbi:MAG: hypothetical protein VKS61_15545 [Candidatus Sericytochromatia bacterium]|nr:hypothetical protein [Candidatus Sericytochromatia bacterium]
MTPPNRGGFADYDDPDFDSEWFDDEAYDRALEGGYEEEPAPRSSGGKDVRPPAQAGQAVAGPVRPRPGVSPRAAVVPVVVTLTAVVLAVGAGFYVVVRAAESGLGGPLGEAGLRVQAALAALRGAPVASPPPVLEEPAGEPTPEAGPATSPVQAAPEASVAAALEASDPLVAAIASAAGPGPGKPVEAPAGASLAPVVSSPTPAAATARPPVATATGKPGGAAGAPSATPELLAASPVGKPPKVAGASRAPAAPKAGPSARPAAPSPAAVVRVTPTPRGKATPAPLPVASAPKQVPVAPAPGSARATLLFEPNVVLPSVAHVERLWAFTAGLGGRRGRLVVTAHTGYGRFAPALAQRRGGGVAELLRRNTAGTDWVVELRVARQPSPGLVGRQVDVEFVPTP